MSDPSTRPSIRGGFDRTVIQGAASREAARAGRTEVGFEHLLLGVLVNGGPAAQLLMDAGAGLAEARSAIDALLKDDLALLGIDAPLPGPSGPSGAEAPGLLPLSPRLQEIEEDCPWSGGDRALLAALIDDEGGRVRRLLDRMGADPDRIRRDLDEPAAAPVAGGSSTEAAQSPDGREHVTYDVEVPVSAERVWALVSDPERRAEWETASVSPRRLDGGVVELSKESGESVRESIVHSVSGGEVTWLREEEGTTVPRTLRIVMEPVGDRARLHLDMGWGTALRGRIANRFVRWFMQKSLRMRAQAIAQAAAS